ncbi:MAG: 2-oxo acid dehydrogenase subunit E2 [Clostridia bacterium]|nr:2-oxo acid dehydrogenase subunit E2 [Clostridia bacterium]
MANRVIMPKQGLQMTEGTITKWLIQEGESVKEGEPLFEIETDKLSIVIESAYTGTLIKIIKDQGETVPITEVIAIIGEPDEDISDILSLEKSSTDDVKIDQEDKQASNIKKMDRKDMRRDKIFMSPRAKKLAVEKGINIAQINGTGPNGRIVEKDVYEYIDTIPKATPTAKKLIEAENLDAKTIQGSGHYGRIYREDVEKVLHTTNETPDIRKEKTIPLTAMRKTISERMCRSQREMAQTNHKIKVDVTELIKLREIYKKQDIKISYNDIIVKMAALALKEYPEMNASLSGDNLILKDYVNMGIAVAVSNGLIVPVIRDADLMSIKDISDASKILIEKVQTGQLSSEDYIGGTFTISNLGMYDIDEFVAIINPPEAGILAVGKMEYVPIAVNEVDLEIKPIIKLTLSYDHRIVDGADAAKFLSRLKQLLEKPCLAL